MELWTIGLTVGICVFGFLYRRGQQHLLNVEKLRQKIMDKHRNIEFLGRVAYQGGLPEMPKLIYLNVAVADEYLLLFDDLGNSGTVALSQWNKVEKFSICQKADLRKKSVVLLGPMLSLFVKEKIRHFILIKYVDSQHVKNNILLEANSPAILDNIYEKINTAFKRFKKFTNGSPSLVSC